MLSPIGLCADSKGKQTRKVKISVKQRAHISQLYVPHSLYCQTWFILCGTYHISINISPAIQSNFTRHLKTAIKGTSRGISVAQTSFLSSLLLKTMMKSTQVSSCFNTYRPTMQPSSSVPLLNLCLAPRTSGVPKNTVEEYTAIPDLPDLRISYPRLAVVEDGGEEVIRMLWIPSKASMSHSAETV